VSAPASAAYLCEGCGLGERLDVDALAAIAEREQKMDLVRRHPLLCSQEGVAQIHADIAAGVTQIAIAACSRRAKTEAFHFPEAAVARANLREGVVWVRPAGDPAREATQEMAADYLRMACAEVRRMKVPAGNPDRAECRRVLVVGGGVSGLSAALAVARAGYEATIVEKSSALGGWAAKLHRRVPDREPFRDPVPTGIETLIAEVEAHPSIRVHRNATVAKTAGAPGRFTVEIASEDGALVSETVGAIVQATGFTPYDATKLVEYGYGRSPDIVDQAGLEALARAAAGGPIRRPSDGQPVRTVVFVQCAGQRDASGRHLPYCSGHCCATSIKQAMYFKDADPSVNAIVLYSDLRVPGSGEDFYRSAQAKGVTFVKGSVAEVTEERRVRFRDLILAEESEIEADLVVLATGQVPNAGVDIDTVAQDEPGQWKRESRSVLNLVYRQGKDLPQLAHGFADSHFICFPYETRRTGIYAAGPVRRPMDIAQAVEDATGAALKAIQAIENARSGRAVHPRAGDLSYPIVRLDGCTQCKRCTVECPFGAIDEDEKRYPLFNESRCRRCGTCMGACPVRVISFENYSVETVGAQIKAVEIPDESEDKPRVLVLACENDAYPALDMAGFARRSYSPYVRVVPVRCLGSVNAIWVTDALNAGWDGVALVGCKHGADYQCHFVKGSELAQYRMGKIEDTLKQLALEKERVVTFEAAITDVERLPQRLDEYVRTIVETIGLSPMKGFG